ncbi:hydroxycarboxylic acid receptor 2-like [Bufo gargarizans]|uniref:hydroxycarboxylic acid receptor 2-like n=1 Tax=Bufo gargarizans TaxID=30331 RepID=UPI001CF1304C|nr:hydroxycarboxylic acid receptor 2-like [Bufo gargarizans]
MNSSCCAFVEPILDSALPSMLLLVVIFGVICNSLGLWMICLEVKSWKPNSVYLLSLTLADFVVLLCVLFRADYYIRQENWIYGDIPCRLLLYILAAARAAGMIFLSLIALTRYCRILFPFSKVNNITVKQATCICIALWVSMFTLHSYILTSPRFFYLHNTTQCESFNICPQSPMSWQDAFYISLSSLSLLTISYCTIRIAFHLKDNAIDTNGKVGRAMRFLILITAIFVVCYLPSASIRVAIWVLKTMKYEDCAHFRDANLGFYLTICLTYLYSVLNPALYYFSSPSSHKLLPCLCKENLFRESEAQ